MESRKETANCAANVTSVEYPARSGNVFRNSHPIEKKEEDGLSNILDRIREKVENNDD